MSTDPKGKIIRIRLDNGWPMGKNLTLVQSGQMDSRTRVMRLLTAAFEPVSVQPWRSAVSVLVKQDEDQQRIGLSDPPSFCAAQGHADRNPRFYSRPGAMAA